MKPNFKKVSKIYRKLYYDAHKHRCQLLHEQQTMLDTLAMKETEINYLKKQYSEALDKIIALQEKIAKTEEKG